MHYPPYDFESNVGYPAPTHKVALRGYGPTRDPSPFVDLHGEPVLAGRRAAAGSSVRLTTVSDGDRGDRHGRRPARSARAGRSSATRRSIAGVERGRSGASPSVCDEWDVRALVNHIVSGNLWVPELVGGKSIADVGDRLDGDVLGDDPVAAYDASADGRRRRRSGPGGDGRRRSPCPTGRSPARSTAGTASSTCSSTDGTSPRRPARTPTLEPGPRRGVLGGRRAPGRPAGRQRHVRHGDVGAPPGADRQAALLARLGRRP